MIAIQRVFNFSTTSNSENDFTDIAGLDSQY